MQAGLGRGDRSGLWVKGVCSFPQTFIDMEGSGFSGDLENLRVSVPRPECLHAQVDWGQQIWERGAVLWWMPCI